MQSHYDFVALLGSVSESRTMQRPRFLDFTGNCNVEKLKATKKCLFGKSDPEDTQKLLEEQCQADKKRFLERFGIDLDDIENRPDCGNENKCEKKPGKSRVTRKRIAKSATACKPYNKQARMTGRSLALLHCIASDHPILYFYTLLQI